MGVKNSDFCFQLSHTKNHGISWRKFPILCPWAILEESDLNLLEHLDSHQGALSIILASTPSFLTDSKDYPLLRPPSLEPNRRQNTINVITTSYTETSAAAAQKGSALLPTKRSLIEVSTSPSGGEKLLLTISPRGSGPIYPITYVPLTGPLQHDWDSATSDLTDGRLAHSDLLFSGT